MYNYKICVFNEADKREVFDEKGSYFTPLAVASFSFTSEKDARKMLDALEIEHPDYTVELIYYQGQKGVKLDSKKG